VINSHHLNINCSHIISNILPPFLNIWHLGQAVIKKMRATWISILTTPIMFLKKQEAKMKRANKIISIHILSNHEIKFHLHLWRFPERIIGKQPTLQSNRCYRSLHIHISKNVTIEQEISLNWRRESRIWK